MNGSKRRRVVVAVLAILGVVALAGVAGGVVVVVSGTAADAPVSSPPTATAGSGDAATTPEAGSATVPEAAPAETADAGITRLVDAGWADRTAAATGIPLRALLAYAGAELQLRAERPECGLGWNTLAAIGSVESEHGTIHGGSIGTDGVAAPPIVGIPLDGAGVEAIRDTDDGLLDDDPVWDRAVGPMQFIPGTWAQFAADGDGDGSADVHQIDDATLAAARYLCVSGGDLREAVEWIAAVSSYNSSIDYNHRVAAAADTYAARAG